MSNLFSDIIKRGLDTKILNQVYPLLPILSGRVIPLSTYGKTIYDNGISWSEESLVANFLPVQDSPFLVGNYGTVNIVTDGVPKMSHTIVEACKVTFNDFAWQKIRQNRGAIGVDNLYEKQLTAQIRAWDERVAAIAMYGVPTTATPGLLFNSGIPTIVSTLNFSTASPADMLREMLRIAGFVAEATRNTYLPNLISIPQALHKILNETTFGTVNSESVLQVLMMRLAGLEPYASAGVRFQITAVRTFDDDKVGTVLTDDAENIGLAIWELERFLSPDNTESWNGATDGLASAHRGGTAGVIAMRPESGLIVRFTY